MIIIHFFRAFLIKTEEKKRGEKRGENPRQKKISPLFFVKNRFLSEREN